MYSILIIDGDSESKVNLRENLRKEGYKVYYSDRGKPGMDKAREKNPDLIVTELDLMDMDGFEVIKEARSDLKLKNTPIIVISLKSNDFDKVLALELGADDYIIKPVYFKELAVRIKAQLKYPRIKSVQTELNNDITLKYADMTLKPDQGELTISGERIVFSAKEFEILYALLRNKDKALKKEAIIRGIWGDDIETGSSLINTYIHNIKRKVNKKSKYELIVRLVDKINYKVEIKEKENTAL